MKNRFLITFVLLAIVVATMAGCGKQPEMTEPISNQSTPVETPEASETMDVLIQIDAISMSQ